jgi:hypothetical protein
MEFIILIGVRISGSRSLVLKIDFYTFAHTGFIYWQMYFIFDRKITWMVFFLLIELGISVSRSLVLKINFYTFAHTAFIYWQIYFIFGRKISCMLFLLRMELGVSWVKVTSAKHRFLHFCPYSLHLLTDLFLIWLEDNLHGILPLDGVRGQFDHGHQCSK